MILTSCIYLVFVGILLLLYYVIPKKMQWMLLLIFSLLFIIFSTTDIKIYLYIIFTVLISYLGSNYIYKLENNKNKKIVQTITVIMLVLQLIILKYINFLGTNVVEIINFFGANLKWNLFSIIVPIGISYYTLIAIGYVIDVGRNKIVPQKNILKHSLFLLYFPQLTSGPFTRYDEMENELYAEHKFGYENISFGFQRILWGIFKKLVISERLAIIANTVFDGYTQFSGINIVIGAIAFTLQLYTDFSGCIDIVLGTSQTLGIKLPENFDTPFFSKTIPEFWRRWHMTLNLWFRDYIYFPLGGSRKGKIRTYLNIMIIFLISGLWHGAAWTYIIWGILNGLYCCLYKLLDTTFKPILEKIRKILGLDIKRNTYKLMQIIITFVLTCFAFIFFRAETVSQAIYMISHIANLVPIGKLGLTNSDYIVTLLSLALLFTISLLKQKYNIRKEISNQHIVVKYAIWIGLIILILVFGYYGVGYDSSNFIYQKF